MTETELTDRLREAIVLNGPDVWRTNGYLQDAQQAGLSLADALKRANDITQEVANNGLLFQNIQARITRLAQPSRSQFIEQDLNQIVNAASSLKLSPDFVRNQWVPTVLQRVTVSQKPPQPEAVIVPATVAKPVEEPSFNDLIDNEPKTSTPIAAVSEAPTVIPPVIEPSVPSSRPVVADRPVVQKGPPSPPEPPPVVRSFTATPARVAKGQPVTLSWEVDNLLAVTIDDLGEGLSPVNRGWVKPIKTTDYTLFDANNNPLSTVRVEVIKPDRSGIYGVLFALALLAVIYWFIRSTNKTESIPKSKDKTEHRTGSPSGERPSRKRTISRENSPRQTDTKPAEVPDKQTETATEPVTSSEKTKKAETPAKKSATTDVASSEPSLKPATPADARQGKYEEAFGDKPYDKVELGTDDRGWRRARRNGRWGYINEHDDWVIDPEFDAVTPFRGNTAAAFLNGQLITINRQGEQVRN